MVLRVDLMLDKGLNILFEKRKIDDMKILEKKKILITGGTGSIGQIAVHEFLKFKPSVIRIMDVDETREAVMRHNLKNDSSIRFLLGDVRDKERLKSAVEDIDIIFHLASLKHVSACEYNPMEAVKTNVIGTQNLIEAALEEEVAKVIFTSSDKAVNPCNVLGSTKLLSEKLITAANYYKGARKTVFCSTRFGNVMGSRGSIIPHFKEQIKNGGPLTITDEKMTRFIMSMTDAVDLLLRALQLAQGGEVFVPKMGSAKIIDIVRVLINEICTTPEKMKIQTIGKWPGEKLFEELLTETEAEHTLETKDLFIIKPELTEYLDTQQFIYPEAEPTRVQDYKSSGVVLLNRNQIKDFLLKENLL